MSCWTARPVAPEAWTLVEPRLRRWTREGGSETAWPLYPRWLVLEQGGFLELEGCVPVALEEAA